MSRRGSGSAPPRQSVDRRNSNPDVTVKDKKEKEKDKTIKKGREFSVAVKPEPPELWPVRDLVAAAPGLSKLSPDDIAKVGARPAESLSLLFHRSTLYLEAEVPFCCDSDSGADVRIICFLCSPRQCVITGLMR